MKIAISLIAVFLISTISGEEALYIRDKEQLDFVVNSNKIFDEEIQMFCALLDKDQSTISCDFNGEVDFKKDILPLDILGYFDEKGEEKYYTLLTKTVYGFDRDVSFFSRDRLSDVEYLQSIMPHNKLSKMHNDYQLKVGFGAPDISYSLEFYDNCELHEMYPDLVNYFQKRDQIPSEPTIAAFQHNHTFGEVLGQKTSKMSISITRYFGIEAGRTLAVNYTLNFIHNLPPEILGGGNLIVKQMRKGVKALVRDTRLVCEEK